MLEILANFRFREKIHMRWSDLDEMRHVNNAVYLTYFEQGRINYFQQAVQWNWHKTAMIQARAVIDYKIPLFLKDNPFLYIRTVRIGNKSMEIEHVIMNEQQGAASSHHPNGEDEGSPHQLIAQGTVILVAYDNQLQRSVPIPDSEREKIMNYEKSLLD